MPKRPQQALAACVLAALMAPTALFAANFTLYGAIDEGFTYAHVKKGDDSFQMTAGNYAGSRFGLRGSETISPGLSVNFILEEGYAADSGAFSQPDCMFGRESQVNLSGPWGTIGFGRVGGFTTGSTSLSWYWDMDPFDTGYIDAGMQATQINVWRVNNNTAYYVTPTFAGAKAGVQWSLTGTGSQEATHFSDNDGWANAAIRWDGANARAIAGIEWERFGSKVSGTNTRTDDEYVVKAALVWTPAGSPTSLYGGASWYRNSRRISDTTWDDDGRITYADATGRGLDGTSVYFAAKYVAGSTDYLAQVQYLKGKNKGAEDGAEDDYSRWAAAVGLHHHLTKRTFLYAVATYADGSGFLDDLEGSLTNRAQGHLGIFHRF